MNLNARISCLILVSSAFVSALLVQAATSSTQPNIAIRDRNTKTFTANNNLYTRNSNSNNFGFSGITGLTYDRINDRFYALPSAIESADNEVENGNNNGSRNNRQNNQRNNMEIIEDYDEEQQKHRNEKDEEHRNLGNNNNNNNNKNQRNNNRNGQKQNNKNNNKNKNGNKEQQEERPPPPQFHTVSIKFQTVQVEKTTILKNEHGREYSAGDLNPIAIAYEQNALYIAHEAGSLVTYDGIFVYDLDGVKQNEIALPLVEGGNVTGVTVGGDNGDILYVYFQIMESNIYKIVQMDAFTGDVEEEYFYEAQSSEEDYVAIMALDDDGMLALELIGNGYPYTVNIYHASLTDDDKKNNDKRDRGRRLGNNNNQNNKQQKVSYMQKTLLSTHDNVQSFMSMAFKHSGNENSNRYELVLISNSNYARNAGGGIGGGTFVMVLRVRYKKALLDNHQRKGNYPPADQTCINFCDEYWRTCDHQNSFFAEQRPRGYHHANERNRWLLAGSEAGIPRIGERKGGKSEKKNNRNSGNTIENGAYAQCLGECMLLPRPKNPLEYDMPDPEGVNLRGDTLWCRTRQLQYAATTITNDAVYYCPKAGPSGSGVCTDATVDQATPYELRRQGISTARNLGRCNVREYDTIADCTSSGISDDNIQTVLSLLPDTVKILFMNDNPGITTLRDETFNSLPCPKCIVALYIEEANIASVESGAFRPLENLEILNLGQNTIEELPVGILDNNPYLRQFSMFQGPNKPGLLNSLPSGLFQNTPFIEHIVLDGHPGLVALPDGIFQNLLDCQTVSFARCGLTNDGFPTNVFDDLISLEYFDFAGNQLTSVSASWFRVSLGDYITRVDLTDNSVGTIESGTFDTLYSLEFVYLHGNDIDDIPAGLFNNNEELIAFTL